jgi:hypothetical protein
MANVKMRASIEAKWSTDSLKASVTTTAELAAIAIKLLVEDVGADAARQYIRDELSSYLSTHKMSDSGAPDAKKD